MNVEGDNDLSDEELGSAQDEDDSPDASSILSPASKRAKKRQAAARNKRAKMEAKQQQQQQTSTTSQQPAKSVPGLLVKPASSSSTLKAAASAVNGQTPSSSKTNGASSSSTSGKSLPTPPTFVSDSASINGRLAADSTASSSAPASGKAQLGDPFITTTQQQASTSSSSSLHPASASAYTSQAPSSTAGTDYAASATTETEDEQDASILLDDDESSSSSSEEEEGDASLIESEKANLEEPPTPRPAPPKSVLKAVDQAANSMKSGASSALNAVAQSSAVPSAVQDLATSAKDSDVLKSGETTATAQYGSDHDPSKKWKSIVTRTVWTLVMIAGFCGERSMFLNQSLSFHSADICSLPCDSSHDHGTRLPHHASHVLPGCGLQGDLSTFRCGCQAYTYTSSP